MRWSGFRKVRGQVCKRIAQRIEELGLESLEAYRSFLDRNPDEREVLKYLCRITISRFYRDRGVFDTLRDEILPELASRARTAGESSISVWSAGCASGEEAYSVSLCYRLGSAHSEGVSLRATGTDVDVHLLERARRGCYPEGTLKELPSGWRERAFEYRGEEFCIKPDFREGLSWHLMDVRKEAPNGLFDLILCRNLVFTYFEESLQAECLGRILEHLDLPGCLVIGSHESLPQGQWDLDSADASGTIFRHGRPTPNLTGL